MTPHPHLVRRVIAQRGISIKHASEVTGVPYRTLLTYTTGTNEAPGTMMPEAVWGDFLGALQSAEVAPTGTAEALNRLCFRRRWGTCDVCRATGAAPSTVRRWRAGAVIPAAMWDKIKTEES